MNALVARGYAFRVFAAIIGTATFLLVLWESSIVLGGLGALAVTMLAEKAEESLQEARDIRSQMLALDVKSGKPSRFFLYLRPFSTDGSFEFDQPGKSMWQNMKDAHNPYAGMRDLDYVFENTLRQALKSCGPTLGLGRPSGIVGIGHVETSDRDWQNMASLLMSNAEIIWCIPGPQEGTFWEITKILDDPALLKKTIFVVPPGVSELFRSDWRKLQAGLAAIEAKFPDCPSGPELFSVENGKKSISRPLRSRSFYRIRNFAIRISPRIRLSLFLHRCLRLAIAVALGSTVLYLLYTMLEGF